jgi:hypothetical protein
MKMKLNKMLLLIAILSCFIFVAMPMALAGAESLKDTVASCFPPAPSGYEAQEVDFETPPGKTLEQHLKPGLMGYLTRGYEISRSYEGDQIIDISLGGKAIDMFKFAVAGQTPGCDVVKVGGTKGAIMYEEMFAVVVGEKVVVLFEAEEEWPESKKAILDLAKKFDYKKLESLLK